MNILLVGGAGYLGSVIYQHLIQGWTKLPNDYYDGLVGIVDNLFYNQGPLVFPHWSNHQSFWKCDIDEIPDDVLKSFDVIYLLSALVGAPVCDKFPNEAKRVNTDSVKRLMGRLSPNQQVIFPCTNSGYGIATDVCTEETPMNSISLYGRSKEEAEKIVMEHPKATSFRLATLFGVSPRPRIDLMVNYFVYLATLTKELPIFQGDFLRNFVSVHDVANIMINCIDDERTYGQVYNLGLDEANTTKYKLAEQVAEACGAKITYMDMEDKDKRNYNVSSAKLAKLGYKATCPLSSGIAQLKRYFGTFPAIGSEAHNSILPFIRNA